MIVVDTVRFLGGAKHNRHSRFVLPDMDRSGPWSPSPKFWRGPRTCGVLVPKLETGLGPPDRTFGMSGQTTADYSAHTVQNHRRFASKNGWQRNHSSPFLKTHKRWRKSFEAAYERMTWESWLINLGSTRSGPKLWNKTTGTVKTGKQSSKSTQFEPLPHSIILENFPENRLKLHPYAKQDQIWQLNDPKQNGPFSLQKYHGLIVRCCSHLYQSSAEYWAKRKLQTIYTAKKRPDTRYIENRPIPTLNISSAETPFCQRTQSPQPTIGSIRGMLLWDPCCPIPVRSDMISFPRTLWSKREVSPSQWQRDPDQTYAHVCSTQTKCLSFVKTR